MTDNQITQLLTYLLFLMIFILCALVLVFIVVKMKDSKRKKEENALKSTGEEETKTGSNTATRGYNKQSISKFMEFDKVEDNMIVQKNGNRPYGNRMSRSKL